ncbi:MAG: hypothetical protein Harvfovirus3_36 [Harvfovirus sp.]|uniref:Uncharacterized protein n=1 Tax=Harvfovirus sp. TaxID=2487768 RepID=A0A3G5A322_9VIRU|nr:MAG: hypothetical protein Harvfovirus3_36 [Harvfovirus sp.]
MSVIDDQKKNVCLLEYFYKDEEVNLTLFGSEYSGTFIGARRGIVVVQDPFELNFIAARSVSIVTLAENRNNNCNKIQVNCQDPVPIFIQLLKSLINRPVLIQIGTTFTDGVVSKVSASKKQLTLLSSDVQCTNTILISIESIAVILVPLKNIKGIIFGDPVTLTLTFHNNTTLDIPVDVFQ